MITLYGTSACHLCEIAEGMLEGAGIDFHKVDIADSDELFERYGMTIPVLQRGDGRELNWPFSEASLLEFLR
jgi:glutaredoxin